MSWGAVVIILGELGGQAYTFEDLGGKGKIIQGLGALRSEHTILGIKRA